ncbi:hypothetical protein ETB97_006249 [Aspergillus alliaceus]|uniref:Tat pathway signal sequence n=1 Tax=Petromyces alliaceus TaxID=209559 RepID=A0A5N6FLC9_PETAA|nr:uncharacterized protein BDW43DRAFT_314462 [Aspergillus alliaceus]KAB8230025.1 hypothetical protein BDW43DRAFT_314462 [Aspergillus alliaceus]KAE8388800.1 hypothetical protein BDV23DRAFT_185109 [Aspergillus alliaceus]KAF5857105.1 hypothetical protein ETB97_006249 [Aspergillus burnettii]
MDHRDHSSERSSEDTATASLSLLEQKEVPLADVSQPQSRVKPWLIHAVLLGISFLIFLIAFTLQPTLFQCTRQLSPYSPIIEEGIVKYESKNFENDFHQPSAYRGPPNEATEEAWEGLWHAPAIRVPGENLALLNKSTDQAWLHAPPLSDREDFAALVDVFHQLHCVNALRLAVHKENYYNHFGEWPHGTGPEFTDKLKTMHLDHCIELLRINLMCVADVTPLLFVEDPNAFQGKTPDFNTMHKCRNFWEIREWVFDNMALP